MGGYLAQTGDALGGVVEQLHGLHRRQGEIDRPVELEVPGIGDDSPQRQPGAAPFQGRDQLRVEVEAEHLVAAAGKMQGDPPGAAAEVEDGAPGLGRHRVPEVEIGRVGAALDVMPDRGALQAGTHCQNSFASPRAASSLRSSSSAV